MSPDRDSRYTPDEPDDDYEDDPPRSIFSAAWFRVVVVLLGIGVVGAIAVPYVLDVVNPPMEPLRPIASAPRPAPSPTEGGATPAPAPAPPVAPAPTIPPVVAPAPTAMPTPTAPPPTAAPVRPSEPAPKAAAKSAPAPKAAAKASEPAPAMPAPKDAPRVAAAPSAPPRPRAAEGGEYFVQVGAFKDQETAKRVAARLREDRYPVNESVTRTGAAAAPAPAPRPAPRSSAPAGPDRYDVLVSGGTAAEINAKLAAKGLASEPAADGGVRIRPSLALRDAVALSKDLGTEGFKVQVRRAGGAAASEPAPAASAPRVASGGDGAVLYRVRVGGYPDRAAANRVLRELQEKGYQPFVARGRE